MRNTCAIVEDIELLRNYCATIASLPVTPFTLTPIPLLRKMNRNYRTSTGIPQHCLKVSVSNGKLCIKTSLPYFPECVVQLKMRSFRLRLTCCPRSPVPHKKKVPDGTEKVTDLVFVKPPPQGLLNNANESLQFQGLFR